MNVQWQDLSPIMQLCLGAMIGIELLLALVGVVMVIKTPQNRLSLPRAAWLAITIFIGLFGPIAFFIAGRKPAPISVDAQSRKPVASTIDELYGQR